MKGRYDTTGNLEAQLEPSSNDRVLAKLGISNVDVMEPMKGLVRRVLREAARNVGG